MKIDYKRLDPLDIRTDKNNIFVLGMPRSGTSLVEQILSSHSKVVGGGELQFFLKSVKKSFVKKLDPRFCNFLKKLQ